MDMNADRVDRLDDADWQLIMDVLDAARPDDHPGKKIQIRELAAALLRPANRPLCSQCDGYAVDRLAGGLDTGLCARCAAENHYASLLPEEFDDDASQDAILEHGIKEMAKVWENAKKLREQCEREEANVTQTKWYLWTQEIRNLMGWEERYNGTYVTYFYQPEKSE
jgi:hypothetical protein